MKFKRVALTVSIAMMTVMMSGCLVKKDNSADDSNKAKVEQKSKDKKEQTEEKTDAPVEEHKLSEEDQQAAEKKMQEAAEREAQESAIPEEVNEEEVKNSIMEGKQVLFAILTSRDPEKLEADKGRTGVIERFNTRDKMVAELSPYFTDRYIEDFLTNILKVQEENGQLYIALGDLGMWPEYPQMQIESVAKEEAKAVVDYMVPSGMGDIKHKAEMLYLGGHWKMDKEETVSQN